MSDYLTYVLTDTDPVKHTVLEGEQRRSLGGRPDVPTERVTIFERRLSRSRLLVVDGKGWLVSRHIDRLMECSDMWNASRVD